MTVPNDRSRPCVAQSAKQPIGRPVEQIVIQEQGHPDRDPQDALGISRGGGGAVTMPGWRHTSKWADNDDGG